MAEQVHPRVLLADDEAHIRLLMKTVLTGMQCKIVGMAQNGQEAVALYRLEKPDMLLLDINMPVKNGEEALKEIIREFPNALVIMLTSVSDAESVNKLLDMGASNFIRKDTPLSEIKEIIVSSWKSHFRSEV